MNRKIQSTISRISSLSRVTSNKSCKIKPNYSTLSHNIPKFNLEQHSNIEILSLQNITNFFLLPETFRILVGKLNDLELQLKTLKQSISSWDSNTNLDQILDGYEFLYKKITGSKNNNDLIWGLKSSNENFSNEEICKHLLIELKDLFDQIELMKNIIIRHGLDKRFGSLANEKLINLLKNIN